MKNPALHRHAHLLAVFTFLLIAVGATLTSVIRPLPGAAPTPATLPVDGVAQLAQIHRDLAGIVAVLALGLAILSSPRVRIAAWTAVGLTVLDGLLGLQPGTSGTLHSLIAPLLFSDAVAIAVMTSKGWDAPPVPAEALWPPLRKLAILVPVFLLLQVTLGAAFRHNSIGIVWHILNAMVVLMLVLVLGIGVLRQYPQHPTLRPAATALLVVTGIQVLLGFAAYLILLMVSENNMALIVAGSIHVVTGSLTLAAGIVLTMQLRRGGFIAYNDGAKC